MSRRRATVVAVAETAAALAVTAWIGGMLALGAFTARVVFRDLPRGMAAPTMNTIFGDFDGLIFGALVLLTAALLVRWFARGVVGRADRIALVAGVCLVVLGALDLAWIHRQIEALYLAGRTLDPEFASLHKLSRRSFNLEALCALLLLGGHAFSRRTEAAP